MQQTIMEDKSAIYNWCNFSVQFYSTRELINQTSQVTFLNQLRLANSSVEVNFC